MWRVLAAVLVVGGIYVNADTTTTPIPISPASLTSSSAASTSNASTSTPPVAAPRRVEIIRDSVDVDPTTSCRFPGAPAHSTVTFTDETLSVDAVATYTCERGFELLGPARRTCTGDGVWTPDGVPFCVLNVAAGKAPMQTSTEGGGIPQRAIDGSTSTFFTTDTCTLTRPERVPWWYVNLLEPYMVQLVRLDFGRSCCGPNKPATIVVRVGNNRPDLGTNPICNRFTGFLEEGHPLFLPCNPPMPGAFVSVHLELGSGEPEQLSICEAFVYTDQALPIERCPQFRDQPPGSTATYNGKCYIFYNRQPVKFRDALTFCRSRGGTLVDESNPALQGFISWELWRRHRSDTNSQYWMGAVRDPKDRTNWKWLTGDDVTVSFWNLPGGNEDCARYDGSKGWLWSDTNCNLNLNYICQHQPKACGRPEQPPNSTMVAQSFDVGASVDYACDDGHLLVGPTTRTCLETGFYNEFPPVCKRIECGFPADIPNGNYRLINGSVGYLSQVMYGCDDGFEMVGRAQLTCDIDERWNGPPPRCEAIQCESPPTIQFGKYSMSNNRSIFGTVVEYYCSRGYKLHGPKQIVCLPTGQYDRVPPNCKEDKSTPGVTQTRRPTSQRPTIPSSSTTTTRRTARPTRPSITTYPPLVAPPVTVDDDDVEPGTVREERPHRRPAIRPIGSQPTRVTVPPPPPSSKGTGAYRPNNEDHPQDNEIPNTISDRQDESANAHVPLSVDGAERREPFAARLNLGAIIALGAFGGFVFLAAIVTTIVILIRRNQPGKHYRHRASPDCNTVASFDSSSTTNSRHGALNRYYRQAWQNLHDSAAGSPDATKSGGGGRGGAGRASNHSPLRRKETLDEPVSSYRGAAAAVRDDAAVADAAATREKKRHHHHHHHHDERPRGGQTPGGGGVDRHGKEWRASGNGHREHRKY